MYLDGKQSFEDVLVVEKNDIDHSQCAAEGSGGWELTRNPCGAFAPWVRKRPQPKTVAKRTTVVAFGGLLFWTCFGFSRLKSVNSH